MESYGNVYDTDGKKLITATIYIKNALNVTATIQIFTYGLVEMPSFKWLKNEYVTKSLTFIYKKNADPTQRKPIAQNAIGRRRENDELIYFESRNVTNISRFPSRVFEYAGPEYITYVGFSFNVNVLNVLHINEHVKVTTNF